MLFCRDIVKEMSALHQIIVNCKIKYSLVANEILFSWMVNLSTINGRSDANNNGWNPANKQLVFLMRVDGWNMKISHFLSFKNTFPEFDMTLQQFKDVFASIKKKLDRLELGNSVAVSHLKKIVGIIEN